MSIENLDFDNGKSRHTKMDCVDSVSEYISKEDWRISANANTGYSAAGLVNNLAGKAVANFWLDEVYTAKEGAAHRDGDYHIHDLDSPCGYCCGHDLQRLLNEGFNGVQGRVASRPPKHFREALYQMANFVGILQAEWAGAQAFSSFDTYLAPYVFFDKNYEGMTDNEVKQALVNFIYNLNVPSRWGQCTPSNYKCLCSDGTWATYKELKLGDEICVVDPKTGELKTDVVKRVNVFDAPEMMHRYYDHRGFTFDCTDRHRVIYKNSNEEWVIDESKNIFDKKYVDIPTVCWGKFTPEAFMGEEFDISDELLELITFIMCDGCLMKQGNKTPIIEFYKAKTRYGQDRFEELCSSLGIELTIRETVSKAFGSEMKKYRMRKCDTTMKILELINNDKHLVPDFFKKLSPRQALIVIDTWVLLDGCNEGTQWRLQADTEELQDALCYLAVKARKATTKKRIRIGRNKKDTLFVYIYKTKQQHCKIRLSPSRTDKVWCPTTDTGTFICMTDDGYVFVTGNSPFSNVTIDLFVPNDLKTQLPTRGDVPFFLSIYEEYQKANPDKVAEDNSSWKRLVDALRERLNDHESSVEDLFMNVTYAHFQPELELIDKMFYTVLNEGDNNGQPFTFPIPTINVTEDFDWESEIADVIFANAGRYGSSYFQNFIGSQYKRDENGDLVKDEKAYKPSDVRSMCPLTADTKVLVRSRRENTCVPIGQLWNRANNNGVKYESFYNGVWSPCRAVKIDPQPVYKIKMTNNDVVRMGELHLQPILRDGKEMTVKGMDLRVGDYIPYDMSVVGAYVSEGINIVNGKQYSIIEYIEVDEKYSDNLYCLEVESDEHLFTLKSGMITHNCRLQLDKRELRKKGGGLFGADAQTGSIGVVTINMARLGYTCKGDKKKLYKKLDNLLEMAKSTLEKKRKFITEMNKRGLYPYTKRYVRTLDTFFSTFGTNGMNEMIRNFTNDKENITTSWGVNFAKEILMHMREVALKYQEETGNLYNVEAVPGEGTTYRFAKADQIAYGKDIIQAGTWEQPYYTNSSQLPANFTSDPFEALDLQDNLQTCYNGGCVESGNFVITNEGPMMIDDIVNNFDINNGLKVVSFNPETKKSEWDLVIDAMKIDVSKHDKIRIVGEKKFDVTTSDWHPFFVIDDDGNVVEKRADELKINDKLLQNSMNLFREPKEGDLSDDIAYMIGYFIGDGSMSKTHYYGRKSEKELYLVRFFDSDEKILSKVRDILHENELSKANIIHCDKRSEVLRNIGTTAGALSSLLLSLGFKHGDKTYTVEIPSEVKDKINNRNAYALLSGLIDSDGHIDKQDDVEYFTVSPKLKDDIIWLTTMLGLNPSLMERNEKRYENKNNFRIKIGHRRLYKIEEKLSIVKKFKNVYKETKKWHTNLEYDYVRVTGVSKVDVEDNIFYDLTTEKNHNYLCGKKSYVFIHNTVLHLYMSEPLSSREACKNLVRTVLDNYRLPYISITPSFSICPVHGYIKGHFDHCPICDQEIIKRHKNELG